MPPRTDRFKDYLGSYNFYPNSVQFRTASSKALERWKNVQSFQLSQLIKGKFFFSKDRREILLLKYDLWSRWLYEVENICIERAGDDNKRVTNADIDLIIALSDKTTQIYKNLMLVEHNANFDNRFLNIWLELHETPQKYLIHQIRTLDGLTFEDFFTKLTAVLTSVMQYTLIEIHELDMILCKVENTCETRKYTAECTDKKMLLHKDVVPFIIITDLIDHVFAALGKCLVCERLKVYRKYIHFEVIYLKNYTDAPINPLLIQNIEKLGYQVDFRKSMLGD